MMIHHLSSAAIVDEHGKLVDTLSATDFLFTAQSSLKELGKPVKEYLNDAFGQRTPVVVGKDQVFGDVIEVLAMRDVHRVWIVDEKNGKPIGCVSMSDILASLVSEETHERAKEE